MVLGLELPAELPGVPRPLLLPPGTGGARGRGAGAASPPPSSGGTGTGTGTSSSSGGSRPGPRLACAGTPPRVGGRGGSGGLPTVPSRRFSRDGAAGDEPRGSRRRLDTAIGMGEAGEGRGEGPPGERGGAGGSRSRRWGAGGAQRPLQPGEGRLPAAPSEPSTWAPNCSASSFSATAERDF